MNDRDPEELFAARAAWLAKEDDVASGPPAFASVLAEIRRRDDEARRPLKRHRSVLAVAFAAAAACVVLAVGAPRSKEPAPPVVAEPRESFMCFDDPASLAIETAAYVTDRAVARAEDHFAACLVASPGLSGRGADLDRASPSSLDDVTCGTPRPLTDEIFASRIRGDEL